MSTYTIDLKGEAITSGSTTFTITSPTGTTWPSYSTNCNVVTFLDLSNTSISENCLSETRLPGGGHDTHLYRAGFHPGHR